MGVEVNLTALLFDHHAQPSQVFLTYMKSLTSDVFHYKIFFRETMGIFLIGSTISYFSF